jgi:hypothetical protein
MSLLPCVLGREGFHKGSGASRVVGEYFYNFISLFLFCCNIANWLLVVVKVAIDILNLFSGVA